MKRNTDWETIRAAIDVIYRVTWRLYAGNSVAMREVQPYTLAGIPLKKPRCIWWTNKLGTIPSFITLTPIAPRSIND